MITFRFIPGCCRASSVAVFVLLFTALRSYADETRGEAPSPTPTPVSNASKVNQQPPAETLVSVAKPQGWPKAPSVPKFVAPTHEIRFSVAPIDSELMLSGCFGVPLVPLDGPMDLDENAALARSILKFHGNPLDSNPLEEFVRIHPNSRWNASLLLNLGIIYRNNGFWSKTNPAWESAWELTKNSHSPRIKAVADRSLGEMAMMHGSLGHYERLQSLFAEINNRDVRGPGSELVAEAKAGLWLMLNKPDEAFRCGPQALSRFYMALNPGKPYPSELVNFKSTSKGTSMGEILSYADKIGLPCQVAYREKGAPMLVPAIVNWKVEHFAAITRGLEGEFLSQDLTFGRDCLVSKEALDAEATGYFVVRSGPLPLGWRSVSVDEAGKVFGKGSTGPTGPSSGKCYIISAGGDGGCNNCMGAGEPQPMTSYSFDVAGISLQLSDTPVRYAPPVGPPIQFTITYNHRDTSDRSSIGNVGDKWNFSWQSFIQAASTAATVLYGSGNGQITYTGYDSSTGSFAPELMSHDVLVLVSANSYVLNHSDGSKDVYNLADSSVPARVFLTSSVDRIGNTITFAYDSYYRLQTVTDAIAQSTVLTYGLSTDPTNPSFYQITAVTDPFGRTASFTYNEFGQLASITDVLGITSSFLYGPGDFITTLTTPYGSTAFAGGDTPSSGVAYDRWLTATDPLGAVEKIEWTNNATTFADVNSSGQTSDAPTGFTNDYVNYRTTFFWDKKAMETAPNDKNQAFIYHFLHNVPDNSIMSYVLESTKAPLENRVWMGYPNQTTGAIYVGTTNQPSRISRLLDDNSEQDFYRSFNGIDNLTQAIDPLGRETDYVYDTNLIDILQIKQKNGLGYDLLGTYTYNSHHLPLSYTDAAGQVSTYTYNSFGELLTTTNPKGETTSLAYNSSGYLQSIAGPISGAVTTFTYDGFGRIGTVTDSSGYALSYAYDAADRGISVTYPDGTYTQVIYDKLDSEWTRDRLGQWSLSLYDPLRRLVLQQDPLLRKTIYERCLCGALVGVIDPMGNETKWTIDVQSRVTQKKYADSTIVGYTYENTTSRLKSVTDPNSQTKNFTYYLDNALDEVSYTGTINATASVTSTYDSVYPRIASMADGVGTTSYTYNAITGSSSLGAGQLSSVAGPIASSSVGYTYDELGRVLTNSVDGRSNVTTTAYDSLGRVTSVANPLGTFPMSYWDQTNRLKSITYPNGQVTNYAYYPNSSGGTSGNGDDRLESITNLNSSASNVSTFGYGYDSNGEIQTWSTQLDSSGSQTAVFQDDPAQQLVAAFIPTTAGNPSIEYSYEYDLSGNRTLEQVDNKTTASTMNSLNQLTSQGAGGAMSFAGTVNEPGTLTVSGNPASIDVSGNWEATVPVSAGSNSLALVATDLNGNMANKTIDVTVVGGASRTLTYDANGNVLDNGAGQTYAWDAENRLIAIVQTSGTTGFVYNGLGQRVQETLNGTLIKQWVWGAGPQPLDERNSSGSVAKRFYGALGEQIGGTNYYFTTDHLGSIREVLDSSSAIQARYSYDPFGRKTLVSGTDLADFGFSGDYFHAASGLDLTHYREYDPNLGRWLSRDPVGEVGGLNLYGYVGNDPIGRVDPLGLQEIMLLEEPPIIIPPDLLKQAIDQNGGRNSVDLPDGRRVDLQGKPHFDKATGKDIDCPHTHEPNPPNPAPYDTFPRGVQDVPRPSTGQDILDVLKSLGSSLKSLIMGPPPPQTIGPGNPGRSA
jgi:RHS repeat-associated protein